MNAPELWLCRRERFNRALSAYLIAALAALLIAGTTRLAWVLG